MSERITDDSLQMLLEHSRELQKYKAIGGVEDFQNSLIHADCMEAKAICYEAELDKYKQAEAEGRLVVLPVKVGDTVYTIDLECQDNPDHTKMCFCWNKSCKSCEKAYLRVWENRTKTADIRSIVAQMGLCGEKSGFGKTVFLTSAEAEAALAADKEERNEAD